MLARRYFHFEDLEEVSAGLWKIVRGEARKRNIAAAANLMRDSAAFSASMDRALAEWPKSCLHNLTAENSNRLAWLGHAGCLLGAGSPEENTRCGWHTLSPDEQDAANAAATLVLEAWLKETPANIQLPLFEDAPHGA